MKPQEWNSGAAIIVVSPARSGIFESSAASGPSPSGWPRWAPFGVPGRPRGEDDEAAVLARAARGRRVAESVDQLLERRCSAGASSSLAPGDEALRRRRPRLATSSSRELLVVDQRLGLLALDHVRELRRRRRRCSGRARWRRASTQASVASTKPRWLRHMIATPSPCADPLVGEARGRARSSARGPREKVSVAELVDDRRLVAGSWIAPRRCPSAGEVPQRASSRAIRASLSGRIGRDDPASARTFGVEGPVGERAQRSASLPRQAGRGLSRTRSHGRSLSS